MVARPLAEGPAVDDRGDAAGVRAVDRSDDATVVTTGSGTYTFDVTLDEEQEDLEDARDAEEIIRQGNPTIPLKEITRSLGLEG